MASRTDLWKLRGLSPVAHVHLGDHSLIASDGADVFLVVREGKIERWSADRLEELGAIDHPLPVQQVGAIGRSTIALGGCKEITGHPELMMTCGELYSLGGQHVASFSTKHEIEVLELSDDGRYLAAESSRGLTVIDAATGKTLLARPAWRLLQEVHAWNRPDVMNIRGSELVVSHGDTIEHVDLVTKKTLGKLSVPERTLAVYDSRARRVAVFEGERGRLRLWDVATHKVTRTFELARHMDGANCRHCAIAFDEADEDRLFLTSAYTKDKLELSASTGLVKPESTYTPTSGHEQRDPSGRYVMSIDAGAVRVWDSSRSTTLGTFGRSQAHEPRKKAR